MTSVEILIPVYNEEQALPRTIPVLVEFLSGPAFSYDWRIVIGDNASIDGTPEVGRRLAAEYAGKVDYLRVERKGRGYALKEVWLSSPREILSFMDVDLSTGLDAFPALIRAIAEEGYDIAIGSRLARGAQVTRSIKRRVLTRSYNFLIKALFFTRFSDAQCGFKAVSREVAQRIVPLIEDNNWFFDTELLILAEKLGYRIKDVPVSWVEDTDSRVRIVNTVSDDLRGLLRMRLGRPWRRVAQRARPS